MGSALSQGIVAQPTIDVDPIGFADPLPLRSPTSSPSPTREPSPSPAPTVVETGQRVEVEDVGLALTIPASWVVDQPASHPFDLAVKDLARLEECWLVVEAASLYAGETLADKAPAYAAELGRILDGETVPEWITLTLRSGSAVRRTRAHYGTTASPISGCKARIFRR